VQLTWRIPIMVCLIVALSACVANAATPGELKVIDNAATPDEQKVIDNAATPDEQKVIDIVWQALEPNTSSHDQAAWEVVEVRTVKGREVQDYFEGEPVPGSCAPGTKPPDNAAIDIDGSYWYVQMRPRLATPQPQPTEQFSPTAPPRVPEPFLYQAHFLIDPRTGHVVARKLHCVIY
jgi:hypothetical protein